MQHIAFDIDRYGPLIVFINVLLAEAGLPLPALPMLMMSGAFLAKDRHHVIELIAAGVGGCLIADLAWYWTGRRYGGRVLGVLCKMSLSPDFCVRQTETMFLKIGKWSLLFAKFFPALATISVAMAGITKMPLAAFLLLNGIGALLFVIAAILVGWMFRDAIIHILDAIAELGKLGLLSMILALCLYLLARWWRRQAFIRQLRIDRITVAELRRSIDQGQKPLIFDVRPKESRVREGIIPGAVPAHLQDIDSVAAAYSRDQEVVVYCACPNEASAALAAKHLKQAGFKKIRPLIGGIDAWIRAGQPLERPMRSP